MFCSKCHFLRYTSTIKNKKVKNLATSIATEVKKIEDLPGPRGLPIIGTTLSLMMAGSSPKLHQYIDKRHKQFGAIFKESIGPVPCVFISDPDAMRTVFAHEGKYPVHLLPEAWTTYNHLHNASRGLFFMDGEEWLHFRRILNPLLLKGDQTWIEESCRPAINNLVQRIEGTFSDRSPIKENTSFKRLMYQWSLEIMISVLIGPKTYTKINDKIQDKIKFLASNVHLVFETTSKLALIPSKIAAQYRISRWIKFEQTVATAIQSAADLVELLADNMENEGLLSKLKSQMTFNELVKIVTDLILAAGDTTAYSMEWILYLIAKHEDVQESLRTKLETFRKENQRYTTNSYLKNIIKESLRLYPVAPFLTRILPEPVNILGYNIPAGKPLVLSIFSSGRDPANFMDPLKFYPDRWNRSIDGTRGILVQSAALPFAMGARSCIGKKLAEIQLQLTLAELVSNFKIKLLNNNEIDIILKMVAVPSEDLKFRFEKI